MNLLRRIISIFFAAVLIVALVYGMFWLKTRSTTKWNPESAIPSDFSLCFYIKDIGSVKSLLLDESLIFKEINESAVFEGVTVFTEWLINLDSLGRRNSTIDEVMTGSAYIGIYYTEGTTQAILTKSTGDLRATDVWLKNLTNGTRIDKKKHAGIPYYHVSFEEENPVRELYFYERNGVLSVSTHEYLLKSSVLSMEQERTAFELPPFTKISKTAGADAPVNLYVNYTQLDSLISGGFSGGGYPGLSKIFAASVLDIDFGEEKLILNGFTEYSEGGAEIWSEFSRPAGGFTLLEHVPFNPVWFKYISDVDIIREEKIPETDSLRNLVNSLSELQEKQSVFFYLKEGKEYIPCYLLRMTSGLQSEELIRNYDETARESEKLNMGDQEYIIYNIRSSDWNKVFTGIPDELAPMQYVSFFRNVLIMSSSASSIRNILFANMRGTTLNNSESFRSLSSNFASSSNEFYFLNLSVSSELLQKGLSEKLRSQLKNKEGSIKKFNALSFQSSRSDKMNYFRIFLRYGGEMKDRVKTVWERKLDTLAEFKPAIILNHNTGEKEILIQDKLHNLYLISNSGNILWKLPLGGPVLGEVKQVDYYGNQKLQLLFNTADQIFLLDRNGNHVEKFPVRLREKAVAGLSLIDYDRNGDWRIPVPCADGDIYMYDREGKTVSGWRFRSGDFPVENPVQYIRLGEKDFLIAKQPYQLHFLDRRGRSRIRPGKQIEFSKNPVFFDQSGSAPCILATDVSGSLYCFYFDEKVEKLFDNELSRNHQFLAADITGNQKKEFIFIDGEQIMVYDREKKLLFREVLPSEISFPPVVYEFSARDKKIGVVATKAGKIYLYNSDGTQYDGFPLDGASMFSISAFPGLKDRFNLIVCNKDNFLYNYTVK